MSDKTTLTKLLDIFRDSVPYRLPGYHWHLSSTEVGRWHRFKGIRFLGHFISQSWQLFFFVAALECKYIMFKDTVFWWFQKLFWLQKCKIKPKLGKQIISKFFKFKLKQTHTRGNILLFCNTMYDVLNPRTWPSSAWRLTTLSLVAHR